MVLSTNRGGQKNNKLDSELAHCFFPLYCVSGVTKKNFSFLHLIFHPPLALYIIQRKFLKIQRKILKFGILKFWAIKLITKLFNGTSLHSWGRDASFDTHIAISRHHKCRVTNVSFMSKMWKMPYWTHMPSNTCHKYICQYGCQKMRQDLRNEDQSD